MMLLRERPTQEGLLVSVCDRDVLGETFENENVSLTVEREFYDGEEATVEEVVSSLSNAAVANLVGTDAVGVAIAHGFIDESNVLEFEETRHAQYLRL